MRHLLIVAFLALLLFPLPARALSCVEPVMNGEVIERARVIFEGTVVEVISAPAAGEGQPWKSGPAGRFAFKVTKSWKGVEEGATVEIARNTYWGDGFKKGVDYLIIAGPEGDDKETLVAGICGLSARLEHAGKSLAYLKKHFGEGSKAPK